MDFSPHVLVIAWLVTMVAAALQGTVGFGFALVSVPVLTVVDPSLTPIPQIIVTLPLTLYMAWRERGDLDVRGVGVVTLGRFPGVACGAWLLATASRRVIDGIIATIALVAVLIIARARTVRRTLATQLVAGLFSGIGGTTSAIGGPPVALLYRDGSGPALRSTLAAIFSVGIVVTLSVLWATGQVHVHHARTAALLFPAVLVGTLVARPLSMRVEGEPLRRLVLIVSALAAFVLAAKTALG